MRSFRLAAFCSGSVLAVAVLRARSARLCGFLAVSARRRSVPRPPLRRSLRSARACLSARLVCSPSQRKNNPRRLLSVRAARVALSFFRFFFRECPIVRTPQRKPVRRYSQKVRYSISFRRELVKHYLRDNPRKLVKLIVGDYRIGKRI